MWWVPEASRGMEQALSFQPPGQVQLCLCHDPPAAELRQNKSLLFEGTKSKVICYDISRRNIFFLEDWALSKNCFRCLLTLTVTLLATTHTHTHTDPTTVTFNVGIWSVPRLLKTKTSNWFILVLMTFLSYRNPTKMQSFLKDQTSEVGAVIFQVPSTQLDLRKNEKSEQEHFTNS